MKILRPIKLEDQQAFEEFAFRSHLGITSLPKDKALLHQKIVDSLNAFSHDNEDPHTMLYLFVLEDLKSGKILGTSGIRAKTGGQTPLYFYRIEQHHPPSLLPHVPPSLSVLKPVQYDEGPSEICGLYLLPEFRKEGVGRLLSLGRFLFIANFPQRFESQIFADMRGVFDKEEHSLFWEAIGRHFFDVPLDKVFDMAVHDRSFLKDILPKYPIYLSLLSEEVRNVIGNIHSNTRPALNLLEQEGFRFTQEISIFDGGPRIESKTSEVRTVSQSQTAEVVEIVPHLNHSSLEYLISNDSLNFRSCYGSLTFNNSKEVVVDQQLASALLLSKKSILRYVKTHI